VAIPKKEKRVNEEKETALERRQGLSVGKSSAVRFRCAGGPTKRKLGKMVIAPNDVPPPPKRRKSTSKTNARGLINRWKPKSKRRGASKVGSREKGPLPDLGVAVRKEG